MRILLIHNSYQSGGSSGEYTVFNSERELLRNHGHEVIVFERCNDEINSFSPWQRLALLWKTAWSEESYEQMRQFVRHEKPDIAHFNNTLPLISPSAYYACQDEGVPVVKTMHNYRLMCPSGILMHDEVICEECLQHGLHRSIKYGCYRNSRLQTAAIVYKLWMHQRRRTWNEQIDAYISLTDFCREKLTQAGLPAHKIFIKPYFLWNAPEPSYEHEGYAIFLGRVAGWEGARTMVMAWRELGDIPLKIVGDGPIKKEMEELAKREGLPIEFLGHQPWEKCMELLNKAYFLIMPSEHYESFGCVIAEAYGCGKPVLASRLGPSPELVREGETGMLFEPGCAEDLARKVRWFFENEDNTERMARAARAEFEARYTPEQNYGMLMNIYRQAIANKGNGNN